MSELPTPETLLRPEFRGSDDQRLRHVLRSMQAIVDEHLRRLGKPATLMTSEEIDAFCNRVVRYVAFVPDDAEFIDMGTPIAFSGVGGFMAMDRDGEIVGAQMMENGDAIAGVIDSASVMLAPSLDSMVKSGGADISTKDYSVSAMLLLERGLFHGDINVDGTPGTATDLSQYKILVPLIYDMQPQTLAA